MRDALSPTRRGGPLLVISLLYLAAATVIMMWRGISVSPDYILVLLVPVAVASGRFLRFMGDWVPFVALFLGYEAMRGIAGATGISPHVGDVAAVETWLFGGHLPTTELQRLVDWVGVAHQVDVLATLIYFLHFAVPAAVGLALWLVDRTRFLRYTVTLLGMSFAAFVVFLLLPTAPPWYAQDHGAISGFRHVINGTIPNIASPYYRTLNPNQTAAWPSLHAAFPFLGFLSLRASFPRGSWILLGWSAVVWFSVIYLGEHYAIDVIAGIALATVSWVAVEQVVVRRVRAFGGAPRPHRSAAPARHPEEAAA